MSPILIVEDNVSVNRLYGKALSNAGYTVIQAINVGQAIQCLEINAPELILLDMNLPDGNGMSVVNHIRESSKLRHTRIIAISGDPAFGRLAKASGITEFLLKPIALAMLVARVDVALSDSISEANAG